MDNHVTIEDIIKIEDIIELIYLKNFEINDLIISNKRYKYLYYNVINGVYNFYFEKSVFSVKIDNKITYYLDTPDYHESGYIN
jgi:hypothetical protein